MNWCILYFRNMSQQVVIEITSDIADPWCYVGMKRLDNAITAFEEEEEEELKVYLRWHPYINDTSIQPDGEPYDKYHERRTGSDDWIRRIKLESADDGVTFRNWGPQNPFTTWINSINAHRLLYFVRTRCSWERMDRVVHKLFDQYYEYGKNISLVDELIWIGKTMRLSTADDRDVVWHGGIDDVELEELMRDPSAGRNAVLREDAIAKRMAITGLPYFEVKGCEPFTGAQSTQSWIVLLEKEFGYRIR